MQLRRSYSEFNIYVTLNEQVSYALVVYEPLILETIIEPLVVSTPRSQLKSVNIELPLVKINLGGFSAVSSESTVSSTPTPQVILIERSWLASWPVLLCYHLPLLLFAYTAMSAVTLLLLLPAALFLLVARARM